MNVDVTGVSKSYDTDSASTVVALDDVSVSIRSGEFVSLVGPSGCGKTTLLNIIAGLIEQSAGTVGLDPEGSRPGLVFQQPVLLPWRTAVDNVLLPAELGRRTELARREDNRAALVSRARTLLALVGLEGFEDRYPDALSGGMQQRVAIARALLLESRLLLLDEPFSAIDEFTREVMNLELLNIWQDRRFTALFVTHNIFEAVFLSDRVLVMTPRPGRIVEDVEIGLPRPRTRDMIGSEQFSADVLNVRSALTAYWSNAST